MTAPPPTEPSAGQPRVWRVVNTLAILAHLANGMAALAPLYGHRHVGIIAIVLAAAQAAARGQDGRTKSG